MPAQFSLSRYVYTATTTSSHVDYPVSNLNVIGSHPLLYSWRSNNSTSGLNIVCDLGSSKMIQGVGILNVNFTDLNVAHSADNMSYTTFTGSQFTVTRNPFGFYRNLMIVQSVTNRYVRLNIPTQTPVGGAAYFEVGMVWITGTVNTFPHGPKLGLRQTPKQPVTRVGNDIATAGPWTSEEEWSVTVPKALTGFYSLVALSGQALPMLLYKNLGDRSEVGIFRFRDVVSFTRNGTTTDLNPAWEEMA